MTEIYSKKRAARIIVVDSLNRALYHRRPNSSNSEPGKFQLIGGKVEEDESFKRAAKRELREELGLEVGLNQLFPLIVTETEKWMTVTYIYWLNGIFLAQYPLNDEIGEVEVMSVQDALKAGLAIEHNIIVEDFAKVVGVENDPAIR